MHDVHKLLCLPLSEYLTNCKLASERQHGQNLHSASLEARSTFCLIRRCLDLFLLHPEAVDLICEAGVESRDATNTNGQLLSKCLLRMHAVFVSHTSQTLQTEVSERSLTISPSQIHYPQEVTDISHKDQECHCLEAQPAAVELPHCRNTMIEGPLGSPNIKMIP